MLANKYDHRNIESKWQALWEKEFTFKAVDRTGGKKAYILDMFPYPSAQGLHVGHPEGYTATDIYCRYLRMKGVNVLHPMGWDAFGLPAENYAIKIGKHPREITQQNIENFRRQIKSLGFSYDWTREVNTADPTYYKWTQWLFLKFYEKGLAYRKKAPVNWCSSCQTVLANEQVVPIRHGSLRGDSVEPGHPESDRGVGGECERCHKPVEQRQMKQWFFKITDYAEELLKGLDDLDWPENIKEMQKNWIGKSDGAVVRFPLVVGDLSLRAQRSNLVADKVKDRHVSIDIETRDDTTDNVIEVFTTRLDTIFGATYLVLAPEHPLLNELKPQITNWLEVEKYIKKTQGKTELERKAEVKEKTGIKLEGLMAVNPASNEEIPIFIADYVLTSYGTGAIMAVPAHDERDFEFAKKFNLPIREVVIPNRIDKNNPPVSGKKVSERRNIHCIVINPQNSKILCLRWKKYPWITFPMGGINDNEEVVAAAKREITEETGFVDLKLIKILGGEVRAEYFAAHKDENRVAFTQAVMFELQSEKVVPVSPDERESFDVIWLDKNEIVYPKVVHAELDDWILRWDSDSYCYIGEGVLRNSGEFSGLESVKAMEKIAKKIGAKLKTQYRLRDWLISRQRYWGAPIPIIYCDQCGTVPVLEKDLPVVLPDDVDFRPHGESPLVRSKSFHNVKCPKCGKLARRESDTMDTFVDSAWYWLRYCDPQNDKEAFAAKKIKTWCPVDFYVGGAEHAVMHLLYARFFTKVLADLKYIRFREPFLKLRNQGLILGEDGQKMSKSRGNVVNPDEIVEKFGADTFRLYEMFMGPLEDAKPWNASSIIGLRRFLERVWQAIGEITAGINQGKFKNEQHQSVIIHSTVKKVSDDIESFKFNTAISALMEFLNKKDFIAENKVDTEAVKKFLILLYPFVPHIAAELWQGLKVNTMIWDEVWPSYDKKLLQQEIMKIAIQINGKLRGNIECQPGVTEKEITALAGNAANVTKYLTGKKIVRTIYVPNKLINFVIH
ncbi:MAG: class I tRNA ligase family protein [Patescibacteria group bacterium]